MGGGKGKLTNFGIGKEVIWGTAVASTIYLPYTSETITDPIEALVPTSLMAKRWEPDSLEGGTMVAGDSVHEVHPAGIGNLLRSALRSPETTTNPASGSYTHVFQPSTGRAILSDTAQASTSGSLIYLTAIATDDMYNGCWCHIKTGTAAGQWVIITDTVASAKTIAVVTSPACIATDTLEIVAGPEYCMYHPTYTVEVFRDLIGATPSAQYTGMAINNLAFNIAAGAKILTATASWLGKAPSNVAKSTGVNLPTTDPFMWDDCLLGVGLKHVQATATGGTTTTLVDTGTWTVNAEIGNLVLTTGGTGVNQCRRIISNTTDALTVSLWHTAPDATTTYKIFYGADLITDMNFSWNNGLVPIPTINYSKYIHHIEADAYVTGAVSKTIIPETTTDYATYFRGWTTREWCLFFHGAAITTNHYYDLIFHFPKVKFMTYPINIGGPGSVRVAADMKIEYDNTAGVLYGVKCILQNNTSAY